MIQPEIITIATTWERKQMWEPTEGLKTQLINGIVILPNCKLFQVGEKILVSMSHADLLRSKKVWEAFGELSRRVESEVEDLILESAIA